MAEGVKIEGLQELNMALGLLAPELEKEVLRDLNTSGITMQSDIQSGYKNGPATGNQRPDGSRASAPGEAPMTDTGELASYTMFGTSTEKKLTVEVKNTAVTQKGGHFYGALLEFGWGKEWLARPLWRPVRDKEEPKLYKRVVGTVRNFVRRKNR